MDEELTAYHEAGHACVATLCGARVARLTIEPEWDDGPTRFGDTQVEWLLGRTSPEQLARAKAQTALAGPVAEMIYSGEPYHPAFVPQWMGDWEHAVNELRALHSQPQRLMKALETMTRELYHLLKSEPAWSAVAALADELLAHETLEPEQIQSTLSFWLARVD